MKEYKKEKAKIKMNANNKKNILKTCECGCNAPVKNRFITGHNRRLIAGKDHPMYGRKPWNYGLTKETDERILKYSIERIGKKGHPAWNKEIAWSDDVKEKIRKTLTGRKLPLEHRLNIIKNALRGKNHPNYIDGGSIKPYSKEFNSLLKEEVRKRDYYICQNCNITEKNHIKKCGFVLEIHHIDYNKNNNKKSNLITLCLSCNIKANSNRDYWRKYYQCLILKK